MTAQQIFAKIEENNMYLDLIEGESDAVHQEIRAALIASNAIMRKEAAALGVIII